MIHFGLMKEYIENIYSQNIAWYNFYNVSRDGLKLSSSLAYTFSYRGDELYCQHCDQLIDCVFEGHNCPGEPLHMSSLL
jgi:hypothetical protein